MFSSNQAVFLLYTGHMVERVTVGTVTLKRSVCYGNNLPSKQVSFNVWAWVLFLEHTNISDVFKIVPKADYQR